MINEAISLLPIRFYLILNPHKTEKAVKRQNTLPLYSLLVWIFNKMIIDVLLCINVSFNGIWSSNPGLSNIWVVGDRPIGHPPGVLPFFFPHPPALCRQPSPTPKHKCNPAPFPAMHRVWTAQHHPSLPMCGMWAAWSPPLYHLAFPPEQEQEAWSRSWRRKAESGDPATVVAATMGTVVSGKEPSGHILTPWVPPVGQPLCNQTLYHLEWAQKGWGKVVHLSLTDIFLALWVFNYTILTLYSLRVFYFIVLKPISCHEKYCQIFHSGVTQFIINFPHISLFLFYPHWLSSNTSLWK